MNIIDRGSGPPLVIVPGLQGRWEYVEPAVDALAVHFRVLTFPLCDEPSASVRFEPAHGLDAYAEQVRAVLDEKAVARAAICGVSFGGVIALRFAASQPSRTSGLILVSTPRPGFGLRRRHQIYVRMPWICGPLFLAESPWRMRPELRAAIPDVKARRRFSALALKTLVRAPLSTGRMAARARLLTSVDVRPDCGRVSAPTLVVTGEHGLDYVVPVDGSSEYVRLIQGARSAVIPQTGHLGSITRPDIFATIVRDFLTAHAGARSPDAAA